MAHLSTFAVHTKKQEQNVLASCLFSTWLWFYRQVRLALDEIDGEEKSSLSTEDILRISRGENGDNNHVSNEERWHTFRPYNRTHKQKKQGLKILAFLHLILRGYGFTVMYPSKQQVFNICC